MESATQPLELRPLVMTAPAPLAELYERHYATVYRAALRVTGNPADAEDVLQTVFLRLLNQAGRLDLAGLPGAYFRRAAVNAALDILRLRVSHSESSLDETFPQPAVESTALLKERLRRAIAALDLNDAALFLLRHVEGVSNEELAGMFGQEKNNIAVRLHRIRQTLQTQLGS